MKYRMMNHTGLSVSALSYGASSLGSVFHDINEQEGIRTVHEAVAQGINMIDVSPYYGLTKAEAVLGKAIKEMDRNAFILSTKAGRYGSSEFDFSAERIIRSVDESLKRLSTDYIDILYLHDIEFATDLKQIIEESIPAMQKLKEQGKIRFAGVSGYPLEVFKKVLERSHVDVILSYCHYSLNDTSIEEIIPFLQHKKVDLVNASPLSMGLLTKRGAPDWHPASTELKAVCSSAAQHCTAKGEDIAKLAMQFSLSNEQIPTTLVSTANPENLRSNMAWIEQPVDESLLQEVKEILASVHNQTWVSGNPAHNMM